MRRKRSLRRNLSFHAKLREIRRKLKTEEEHMETILASVEDCNHAVEEGKNEIIEILNSRATTKERHSASMQ